MAIRTVLRRPFYICGYAAETTLENNDADIAALYSDFFTSGKEKLLLSLPGCRSGYYGMEWYTAGHKSFFYLLGKEVDKGTKAPSGAIIKYIRAARYAVVELSAGTDIVKAWTEFFYTAIPYAGFAPDDSYGFYFEFYPESITGVCELWTPVIEI